ncbi:hypothetical protein XAC3810_100060 [Xanthomonas citri pv. citri]|uniref:Uncharacterized protein n=1 Tax=Xanthomonas citri pv. citri TaxID=611301 RepID=A0A0U5BZD0_XANCI|nr:hypothetical protein XAC902_110059 [Xanthomonas citri pv. citri]CEE22275.1 hypothetical protein XAC3810_100060 [Xanthomonas citri pv. citri]CEE23347.1 hypothetical protein XAC2911_110060 [Xanthomonas citri pv. citri]CEE56808.1 hypothetical protein XAC3608_140059 [Xanthomonas citri pv. citri]CEE64151.1 hypothetical protein XACLC80_110060 [Xanthomonas citri pv. citri]
MVRCASLGREVRRKPIWRAQLVHWHYLLVHECGIENALMEYLLCWNRIIGNQRIPRFLSA